MSPGGIEPPSSGIPSPLAIINDLVSQTSSPKPEILSVELWALYIKQV